MQSDLCVCLGFAVEKRLVLIVIIETYAFSSTSLLWEGDNYIKDYWRHLLSGSSSSCKLTIIFQVTSDHFILINFPVLLSSEHQEFHFPDFPFLWNEGLNFITHQPFYTPPMRTSTRPWCRPVFTQLQRRGLEKRFQTTKYVTKRERLQIGAMLGLSETQVKVWFQNRRTKWRHEAAKKEKKEEKQLKEQSSTKTINCVQKEELKEEKEQEEE